MSIVKIEIDGQEIEAEAGCRVIEAADKAGISIPRFCYHHKLSIAANCRMCLVDVQNAPKPMPACATFVAEGMKVKTKSEKALSAQKAVMEFLLINHPLDCPICDQGGECELQDVALGFGRDHSSYEESKRVIRDKDIGPLISTEMTRCIHCTRCVRFGEEVAGFRELGATGRGEGMAIETFLDKSIDSELSGNVIDLCPVGALTSKPFRYKARAWELRQKQSISPHDCIGTNISLHTYENKVMRVVPRENEKVNETWISDRDRFSYEALLHVDRVKNPYIKKHGTLEEVSWEEALSFSAKAVESITDKHGSDAIGALTTSNSTNEELFLLQKLIRQLGSDNIDYRLRQTDFSDNYVFSEDLGVSLEALEKSELILIIGSNIHKEVPLLGHRVRKAVKAGCKVLTINPASYNYNFDAINYVSNDGHIVNFLEQVLAKLFEMQGKTRKVPSAVQAALSNAGSSQEASEFANELLKHKKVSVLTGHSAIVSKDFSLIRYLGKQVAETLSATYGEISFGANSKGAFLAKSYPTNPENSVVKIISSNLKAYLLLNVEPDLDCSLNRKLLTALEGADLVISISPYLSQSMKKVVDVVLPSSVYSENSGTYTNADGLWQSFTASTTPYEQSKPAWKILRVLANFSNLEEFDYATSNDVLMDMQQSLSTSFEQADYTFIPNSFEVKSQALFRLAPTSIYDSDMVVRRSSSLAKTKDKLDGAVYINSNTLHKYNLNLNNRAQVTQSGVSLKLKIILDESLKDGVVSIPSSKLTTAALGNTEAGIEIKEG